jgi:2-polyprenyl-3-methyl-5-hydroxy-6-metoxy-1,4-benzoquinol methylase
MTDIQKYYETYDEDCRLSKDRAHRIEFQATIEVLHPFLSGKRQILDAGCGTGVYTEYLCRRGHSITAVDPVE